MWLWVSRSLTSLGQKLLFFFFFGGGGGGGGGGEGGGGVCVCVCMYSQCLAQFSDFLLEAPPSGNALYISFSSGVLYQSHLLRQTSNMLIKDHRGDGIQ